MKKGRFGIVLCFYPIAGFACVILRQPVLCLILLALAAFLEQDEWTTRQTMQAWFLSLIVAFFSEAVPRGVALVTIPLITKILTAVTGVLSVLVYLAAIIVSILAILRVMKGQEADLTPLSELAYLVFGKKKPRSLPAQAPHQPAAPPADAAPDRPDSENK